METLLILVEETAQNNRLDVWLSQEISDLSRSRLQSLIEKGHVTINDQICQSKKEIVKKGDRVSVTIPDAEPLDLKPEEIPLDILYEDQYLIIINKPAGLVVHPAPGHHHGTLVNALLAHCPLAEIGGVQRPGIVHRLDKDTSGAIAIAKTDITSPIKSQNREKRIFRHSLWFTQNHHRNH
jgi:23S rRNA pseudouridine1911/1915/1917 synthase